MHGATIKILILCSSLIVRYQVSNPSEVQTIFSFTDSCSSREEEDIRKATLASIHRI